MTKQWQVMVPDGGHDRMFYVGADDPADASELAVAKCKDPGPVAIIPSDRDLGLLEGEIQESHDITPR